MTRVGGAAGCPAAAEALFTGLALYRRATTRQCLTAIANGPDRGKGAIFWLWFRVLALAALVAAQGRPWRWITIPRPCGGGAMG